MRRNLMPIGRFARSCRLSVKALRHYDELGLLEPASVDPNSGYRYYAREQAGVAVMIGMLRSLDLPLNVIRRVLAAEPAELSALVKAEGERVRAEVAARERTLLSLEHIARAGRLMPYDVHHRELPALTVACLEGVTDPNHLVHDTGQLIYAVLDELRLAGQQVQPPVGSVNDFEADDRIRVRAFAAVGEGKVSLQRAEAVRLEGGPAAWLEHAGPYETLGLAHHALFAWAQERGHEPLGPIYEFYRNDPADVAPEALETEVALPLAPPA